MFSRYARAGEASGRQPAFAGHAMVSSPNGWATGVGVQVLREGGNAVDAAIAVSAALMVAVPHQCGLGGDAFWLVRPAAGPTYALNASGRSSSGALLEELLDRGFRLMPERGGPSVTVPGVVDGWIAAGSRFGKGRLERLLGPAIDAATKGLPATPYLVRQLEASDALLASRPESARVFRPAGRPLRVGERLVLPDMARTMRVLADDPRAFYKGRLAERIAATVIAEGGRLSPEDLVEHQSEWTAPVARGFEGWHVEEFPPNSQGWLTLLTLGVAVRAGAMRRSAARTHRLIEAAQIARTVRDGVLADAAEMPNPADWYLDPARLGPLSELVSSRTGAFTAVHRILGQAASGSGSNGRGDTAHFAVVDAGGLAVSCIQSVYSDFGTGIIVPGTGIVLQNRGWAFSLQPDHPNVLAPRKRPSHTLAPALATRDGESIAVFGCMGGDAQTQVHCQLLVGLVVDGLDPASAIAAPRWFTRPAGPGYEVLVERGHPHADALANLGHATVAVRRYDEAMGHAQVILRDPQTGVLCGAADPRSDGMALGF